MTRRSLVALAATVAGALVATGIGAPAALAAGRGPTLELSVIYATRSDGGASVDPQLRDLPPLTKEPFVRYNVYKLLDRRLFPLEANKPISLPLPNGRVLQVTLGGITLEKNEKRYQLEAQIAEPGKAAFLKNLQVTTSENEPFFVGGQAYGGGVMFLELMVKP
jgi:hypothetical protein